MPYTIKKTVADILAISKGPSRDEVWDIEEKPKNIGSMTESYCNKHPADDRYARGKPFYTDHRDIISHFALNTDSYVNFIFGNRTKIGERVLQSSYGFMQTHGEYAMGYKKSTLSNEKLSKFKEDFTRFLDSIIEDKNDSSDKQLERHVEGLGPREAIPFFIDYFQKNEGELQKISRFFDSAFMQAAVLDLYTSTCSFIDQEKDAKIEKIRLSNGDNIKSKIKSQRSSASKRKKNLQEKIFSDLTDEQKKESYSFTNLSPEFCQKYRKLAFENIRHTVGTIGSKTKILGYIINEDEKTSQDFDHRNGIERLEILRKDCCGTDKYSYYFIRDLFSEVISLNKEVLVKAEWPTEPESLIRKIDETTICLDNKKLARVYDLIAVLFADPRMTKQFSKTPDDPTRGIKLPPGMELRADPAFVLMPELVKDMPETVDQD